MSEFPDDAAPAADAPSIYLAYARRGKTQWWRYPCAVAAGLLLFVVIVIAAVLALSLLHVLPPGIAGELTRPMAGKFHATAQRVVAHDNFAAQHHEQVVAVVDG